MKALTVLTQGPSETLALGRRIARWLKPGDTVNLVGELGVGKTVLAKGIAAGLGIDPATVTSPTFSLIHEYTGSMPLFHFDAYRLQRLEEWEDLGYEEYFRGNGVSVVEWGDLVEVYLPTEYLEIEINRETVPGDKRAIQIKAVGCRFDPVVRELGRELEHAGLGDRYSYGNR
ncbi:MAG: tRNA (adenosine(37)-N6)-threonylcarbamoyltransferase complex ATPase subunit type 1 TsaE [Firmicutes bacterium]|nr:tRNA (adenosine(37)-N6)-threonylcarbamoyltransferase complex ATPase subunit type 1 TsaE [Bacillota bacterium]